ncbi:hypothetical protein AQUCO_00200115v1, partial [Aquilegia coerulea]
MVQVYHFLLFFTTLLTFSSSIQENPLGYIPRKYIVQVRYELKPSVILDVETWYRSILDSISKHSDILHVYKTVVHGFVAELTAHQVELIKERPEVLAVHANQALKLHTTHTPAFLGLISKSGASNQLLKNADYGSNIVIGFIDTGISPEGPSFSDNGFSSIPSHWKGDCNGGNNFTVNQCNKKLIGAQFSNRGVSLDDQKRCNSARDTEGHGTFTSSTAAGCNVSNATLFGYASGIASGVAPKARIAVYKACWPNILCSSIDIVAAYDKAIKDGVDVISYSIGYGSARYHEDLISIAQFGAMKHNVFVSSSAGNEGPSGELSNIAPWVTTVGASTIDRKFPTDLVLSNGNIISGESIYSGQSLPEKSLFPIVYAGDFSVNGGESSALCLPGSLDPKLVTGKIVMCEQGYIEPTGDVVKNAGGGGMIMTNVDGHRGELESLYAHVLPTIVLNRTARENILSYLASSKNPLGTIISHGTELNVKPAPVIAEFSSRGPNVESKYIIKPDMIAPGVNILASWPDGIGPTGLPSDARPTGFSIMSGTSASCPHISGVAALLKGSHPGWTPSRIKSAMMTTAYVLDNTGNHLLDEVTYTVAEVWAYGSGHVDPEKALDPGLVYDLEIDDYIDFLCASNYSELDIAKITHTPINCKEGLKPWDLNYPSISVAFDQSDTLEYEVSVTRTATNVGEGASNYTVKIQNPTGVLITVEPPKLEFALKDQKLSYMVKISAKSMELHCGKFTTAFGSMTWDDQKHV